MPRRRRRDRAGITALTFDLQMDLEHGPEGGLDRSMDYVTPDMMTLRAAWVLHRAKIMEPIAEGRFRNPYLVGRRPWAFWAFDVDPKQRPERWEIMGDDETAALRRLGQLTPAEEALLAAEHDTELRVSACRCASCAASAPDPVAA